SWRAVAAAAAHALEEQRKVDSLQDPMFLANNAVLPRLVRSGCVEELVLQIHRANSAAFDAGQINSILAKSAETPVPGEGFPARPQEARLRAAIRAGHLPRAKEYFSKLTWSGDVHPDQRDLAEVAHDAVNIGLDAGQGRIDIRRVVAAWNGQSADPVGRSLPQPILENAVLSAATESDRKPVLPSLGVLFKESLAQEGAEAFWKKLLARRQRDLVSGSDLALLETADLAEAFGKSFKNPNFGFSYWMRTAELTLNANGNNAL